MVSNFDLFSDKIELISKNSKKQILEMLININEERRMKRNKILENQKEIEEKETEGKEEESLSIFSSIFNWKFMIFIVLILIIYLAVYFKYADNEENTFFSYVPIINIIGLILFFIILFTL